jgi:hypothetical protein
MMNVIQDYIAMAQKQVRRRCRIVGGKQSADRSRFRVGAESLSFFPFSSPPCSRHESQERAQGDTLRAKNKEQYF